MERCTGKQFVDIGGAAEDISALWAELEGYAADGTWSLDREAIRKYDEFGMGAHPLAFDCATKVPPRSLVWVFREGDQISIGNITPRDTNELDDAQYARIVNIFIEQVVAQTSVGSRVTVRAK